METPEEKSEKLQKEVDYYKNKLNELSGSIVSRDYKVAEMNNELRQMRTGFELIAAFNQFKPVPFFEDIYDHFTEEINVKLQNDLSLVLLPVTYMPDYFAPTFIKGNTIGDLSQIIQERIYIAHSYSDQKNSLLVNSQTTQTPFIQKLVQLFGIPYFILTPVIVQNQVISYLFTGRKTETILFASSRLLMHDVYALEAIAGVIAAIKNQHEQFELLEKERTRISIDMHDEIGSGITHIALLSELIQTQTKDDNPLKKDISIIATSAHKLVQTMSEIIWALDPHNDTLENLLSYIREQSQQYFEPLDVQFIIDFPESVPEIKLSNAQRRNIYLVTREALNNAMKHSGACTIKLKMEVTKVGYCFSVMDNGKGMNGKNKPGSNGIRNMKKRMDNIGGTIEWRVLEEGLSVEYCIPA